MERTAVERPAVVDQMAAGQLAADEVAAGQLAAGQALVDEVAADEVAAGPAGTAPAGAPGSMPAPLERAVYGLFVTSALELAIRHGVTARLAEHGAASGPELAAALDLDGETLGRLLTVLRAFGVLTADPHGRYAVPDAALPYLDPREPRYLGGFVRHLMESTTERLPRLDDRLSRTRPGAEAAAPEPLDEPFAELYRDAAATARFLDAMWQLSFDVSVELVELAGLAGARELVDVGGAGGPFAVAALLRHPALRATVFDLPQVGAKLAEARATHRLGDRLAFAPGDFHREELPPGDCLAFGYILSDWTDETCLALLRKAYRACAPGGAVLVMERLFDEDGYLPPATAAMNLAMHVETQGRHRTAAEYLGLLRAAGFTGCELRRSGREKHLLLGRRPQERPAEGGAP
ncbi:methyltransferase [Kitasatospora sp. NBC_01287]|uniref:methyltransferase n=1 Tax=Kitasatospora sp. NBC_01287 TaxID=2903573 RepID=UPI00225845BB|nr:methyltransferase [Kitasatospora sp. NBC_01287]MCX4749995.1 methyltransferase [Kitasatospora sp. NBC_01287]